MRTTAIVPYLLAPLFLTLAAGTLPVRAEVNLVFGVYVSDKPTEMVRKFRPVLDALEASMSGELGEPVHIRMRVAGDYDTGIADLVTGAVDFARFGPASYVLAKQRNPELRILAVESESGTKVFYGIICVAEESPIRTLEDLRGRSFAFGSQRSTIGRYLSQNLLSRHGITAKDLAAYDYLGRHDRVGTAVARGRFDAGALKEGTFKKLVAKGAPIRAIASFPNVTKPWIARGGLAPEIFAALRAALLRMRDPTALKALKKDGFLEGRDDDYAVIRRAMASSDRFFE